MSAHTALISACEKGDTVEKAMGLFAEMQQRDLSIYTGLISACEKGDEVEKAMELPRCSQGTWSPMRGKGKGKRKGKG